MTMEAGTTCPAGGERPLTPGEIVLASSIFGTAIDYGKVTIRRRKFFPFQARTVTMAPCGHLHFHPESKAYRDDFAQGPLLLAGHFIHEMTHVWQTQAKGRLYLPLHRHPFCRYSYTIHPGWPLHRYGIEQQAEIVRHAFLIRNGLPVAGVADENVYAHLVRFPGAKPRL